VEAYRPNMPKH